MLTLLKVDGAGMVLDVADVEFKDDYIDMKMSTVGAEEYHKFPPQLYYSRQMFVTFAQENGLRHKIDPQDISNYPNTPFRFNFFFWKV